MRIAKTRLCRFAVVAMAVGCGLTLTGCTSDARPSAGPTAAGPASPAAVHGVVPIERPPFGTPGTALDVFDPKTGHLTRSIRIGWNVARDAVFSADWSLMATDTDLTDIGATPGVILGRRDGDEYQKVGSWTPQPSLTGGAQRYSDPTFNPVDKRLWFAQRALTSVQPSDSDVWFSVDPVHPTEPLRQEQHAPPLTDPAGKVVQPQQLNLKVDNATDDSVARATTSSSGLLVASVEGGWRLPTTSSGGFLDYQCKRRISPQELLCVGGAMDAAGAVVGLQVPAHGGNAVLRQIFPPAADGSRIRDALLSPDGSTVLLDTDYAWFVGPVTGSASPPQAFPALERDTERILGWY